MFTVVALVLLGWFLADLVSGLVHVVIDNGPERFAICRAFRKHHDERDDPVNDLPRVVVFAAGALAGAAVIGISLGSLACVAVLVFSIGAALPQTSHAWSHDVIAGRKVNRVIRALQFARVLLPPAFHVRHHDDIRGHYCILNGWAEPVLRGIRWFFT